MAVVAMSGWWTLPTPAQTPTSKAGVVGIGNFSHIVTSLDRSVEFYRDVIGLQPDGAPRTFSGELAMKVGASNAKPSSRAGRIRVLQVCS